VDETLSGAVACVSRAWDEKTACRSVSFTTLSNGKTSRLEEYWGGVGEAPEWRCSMNTGKRISKEEKGNWHGPGRKAPD
jgi:hypothetical protein